jgi:hypothetical protein
MRRKAIPPPIPIAQPRMKPIKALVFPTGIQPIAVLIDSSPQPVVGPGEVEDVTLPLVGGLVVPGKAIQRPEVQVRPVWQELGGLPAKLQQGSFNRPQLRGDWAKEYFGEKTENNKNRAAVNASFLIGLSLA